MSSFHDVRFPLALSRGAVASLVRASEIVQLASGREVRNARWASSLRKWNIAGAISSRERLSDLIAFFEARAGNVHAFRFRDELDFSSGGDVPGPADQLIGQGDGSARSFQLVKDYAGTLRRITRPEPGSVCVSIDGEEATAFVVDAATGVVTFDVAPQVGAAIRAGFLFDVPARFERASLDISLDACRAGRATNISILEVRE